jgi:hypothetical protein
MISSACGTKYNTNIDDTLFLDVRKVPEHVGIARENGWLIRPRYHTSRPKHYRHAENVDESNIAYLMLARPL